MQPITLHIIWGELAVSRYKMGHIDNHVLRAHESYQFKNQDAAEAFLYGIKVSRTPPSWLLVTSLMGLRKLGEPIKSKLHVAIEKGDAEAVEELMKIGIEPNTRFPNGLTPLHLASKKGHFSVANVLLSFGADSRLCTEDNNEESSLHLVVDSYSKDSAKLTNLIIENGAEIDAHDSKRKTPLLKSVEKNNPQLTLYLLKFGANPDYPDDDGSTPRDLIYEKYESVIGDKLIEEIKKEVENFGKKDSSEKKEINIPKPTPYK